MKTLLAILSLAALAGCATQQPGPPNYGTRAYAPPSDPHDWHVVSVTPVNLAPDAPRPANVTVEAMPATPVPAPDNRITYSSRAPVIVNPPVYVPAPVYYPAPAYYPAPVYTDPWYVPFSWSLGLSFGSGWGRHHGGSRWRGHVGVHSR